MKGFIAFLLVLIVAGLGYMIWDREMTKRRSLAVVEARADETLRQSQMQASRDRAVEEAILRREVLIGMSRYEARKAWGRDYDIESYGLTDEERKKGVYEKWRFHENNQGILYVSVNGEVLSISRYDGAKVADVSAPHYASIGSPKDDQLAGTYAISTEPIETNIIVVLRKDHSSFLLLKTGDKSSASNAAQWNIDGDNMIYITGEQTVIKFLWVEDGLKMISSNGVAVQNDVVLKRVPAELAAR